MTIYAQNLGYAILKEMTEASDDLLNVHRISVVPGISLLKLKMY